LFEFLHRLLPPAVGVAAVLLLVGGSDRTLPAATGLKLVLDPTTLPPATFFLRCNVEVR